MTMISRLVMMRMRVIDSIGLLRYGIEGFTSRGRFVWLCNMRSLEELYGWGREQLGSINIRDETEPESNYSSYSSLCCNNLKQSYPTN